MEIESKPKVNYTMEYFVAAGYIVFFCVLAFACLGLFYLNRSAFIPPPSPTNEFAEKLPPTTPTPHISSNSQFEANSILFREDFNGNQNRWLNSQDETKEKIQDGKLFFHSRNEGKYSSISCETCPSLKTPYYLEASLSTNKTTEEAYGIVFNRSYTFDDYFLFMVNAEAMKYFLFHHTSDGWTLRTSGTSFQIQPYPKSTALGVYANKDLLELYINGVIVDSYMESGSSFHPGFFGLYINNSWFGVYADHVVIYEMGD
jgi:hypothetical protein